MDDEMLIHSDLNPANLIVTPHGLRIVDWAWATKAAPWVELALLVQWLIGSGHSAEQAEEG
ncbi:phosphotransferase [Micromonospora tulbaghiae]|uniref:phosphotransferase n=1 Tax=Micromonospora tulbaghiae TaxID=479978 RepID=UPI001FD4325B|nr:phosphotransferase [Micromonospora tulbaghiae]